MKHVFTAALAIGCLASDLRSSAFPTANATSVDALADSYACEARGDLKGAMGASRIAAERAPTHYFPRLRTAHLELLLGMSPDAARDYARAAELAPRAIEPLLGRQQALIAAGSYAEAEAVGHEVLARDPRNYLGASRLAWTLFNLSRPADAAQVYAGVLVLYPGDVEMMTGLGYSELHAGRKRAARDAFRAVLQVAPGHARSLRGLALCR